MSGSRIFVRGVTLCCDGDLPMIADNRATATGSIVYNQERHRPGRKVRKYSWDTPHAHCYDSVRALQSLYIGSRSSTVCYCLKNTPPILSCHACKQSTSFCEHGALFQARFLRKLSSSVGPLLIHNFDKTQPERERKPRNMALGGPSEMSSR